VFEDLGALAAEVFSAPIGAVSFVDCNRDWLKTSSDIGLGQFACVEVLRAAAVHSPYPLVVLDATTDTRFSGASAGHAANAVRFFAGAPLIAPDGFRVGLIFVIDSAPRDSVTPQQVRLLQRLASMTVTAIGARRPRPDVVAASDDEASIPFDTDLFREVIDSFSEGLSVWDAEDRLMLMNPRFRDLHGVHTDILKRGVRYRDLLLEARRRGVFLDDPQESLRSASSDGKRRLRDGYMFQTADGRWRRVTDTPSASGGIVSVYTDVTDLKDREQALNAATRALEIKAEDLSRSTVALNRARIDAENANRLKSRFLANMSHELRTPLNAILGFSEMMTMEMFGSMGSDKYLQYAKDINMSGAHLLSLINDLLDLSKIEAGRFDLTLESVNIEATIAEAVAMVAKTAADKGVRLTTTMSSLAPKTIVADRRAIRQIVMNLLANAVNFTPSGGRVRVNVVPAEQQGVAITVCDTGIGMAKEEIKIAQQPFGQVRKLVDLPIMNSVVPGANGGAYVGARGGTGLGLTVVDALIDLHKGRFRLRSRPGVGSIARCWLPQ
jgi:two-component system, cell cycle sensor histidine kinase PleC